MKPQTHRLSDDFIYLLLLLHMMKFALMCGCYIYIHTYIQLIDTIILLTFPVIIFLENCLRFSWFSSYSGCGMKYS